MQFGFFAHQLRAQEIINRTYDKRAPDGENNGLAPLIGRR
jgi:hypothetical protein